jgi:molecular chaperone DnaK
MRLGVDFGTTHTVAALVDRGNYPIVAFEWGDSVPASLAVRERDGALRCGAEAAAIAGEPGWHLLRSFKRLLRHAGPLTELELGGRRHRLADLLTGYLAHVREAVATASNAGLAPGEPLEAAVSVPANATNDQRFLTLDAFQRAGFDVVTLLNEPSAAGFEYGHRHRRTLSSRREHVLVYDLGGGTFDASLLRIAGRSNEVIASDGVPELGGEDFDAAILELVLRRAALEPPEPPAREALREACRVQKEALSPQSRRFVLDLTPVGRPPLVLPLDEVYAACAGLVARTFEPIEEVLRRAPRTGELSGVELRELAGLYVVGGGSSFPAVLRQLRERFPPQRVRRSPHPQAATAIGLACFLDAEAGFELSDCLGRHFGVWREASAGAEITFDTIFPRDMRLPGPKQPPATAVRRYRPSHDLGHFRFVECGALRDGHPDATAIPWDGIHFPFVPELRDRDDLAVRPVTRLSEPAPEVEERYSCSASGLFEVTLTSLADGYSRSYRVGRASGTGTPDGRRRRER